MRYCIKNVPRVAADRVRVLLGNDGPIRAYGRGARIHNGRRYFQDLPVTLAERLSLYVGTLGAEITQADFVGFTDDGKARVRLCAS